MADEPLIVVELALELALAKGFLIISDSVIDLLSAALETGVPLCVVISTLCICRYQRRFVTYSVRLLPEP